MIHCLVIEPDPEVQAHIQKALQHVPYLLIHLASNTHEAKQAILAKKPMIIFLRCEEDRGGYLEIYDFIKKAHLAVNVVPIISQPTWSFMKSLLQTLPIKDVIPPDADAARVINALHKILYESPKEKKRVVGDYFGFALFAGLLPEFHLRKTLAEARLGLIQTQSVQHLLHYLGEQEDIQPVLAALPTQERLPRELCENLGYIDRDRNLYAWEIGLAEIQKHYLRAWAHLIQQQALPALIPAVVRTGKDDYTVLPPAIQREVIENVLMHAREPQSLQEVMHWFGVAAPSESEANPATFTSIEEIIEYFYEQFMSSQGELAEE